VHNKTIQINYSRKAKERAELNIHGESIVKVAQRRLNKGRESGRAGVFSVGWSTTAFSNFLPCAQNRYMCFCARWLLFMHYLNASERESTNNYSQMTPMYLCGGTLWLLI
jgi:hypothetical protein